jgi:dipeptidyl aminopeptidase/acylaminoacyl peptidase
MTAWVTGSTDSFKAAVAELPWWDLALGFGPSDLATYLQQDFGLPLQNPEGYRTSSPSHLTLNVTTPTLIHAGQVDWRCPASMAEMYYVTLKKLGVPAELVIYQNEHHATTRPRVIIDRMRRICSWFARYGGQPFSDNSAEGYPGPA